MAGAGNRVLTRVHTGVSGQAPAGAILGLLLRKSHSLMGEGAEGETRGDCVLGRRRAG